MRPPSSLFKLKGFSESSENEEVSCSDVESDSGFESGHIFVSGPGSTCSARNKAVAASKAHGEDNRRIEKAILYLDEKVCKAFVVWSMIINFVFVDSCCKRLLMYI